MMQFHDQRVTGLISKKQDQRPLQKGKRTKRQRLIMASSTSSSYNSGDGENVGFCDLGLSCGGGDPVTAANSPANSDELAQSIIVDDVEEDMANCLILLAQGDRNKSQSLLLNSKAIAADEFECKTCNRRFPSFQALGGHRASHTKPKSSQLEIKKLPPPPPPPPPENYQLDKFNNTSLSLQITSNNNKLRIHECSICGAEFASGQALGGHMRRHRPLPVGSRNTTTGNDHESPLQVKKSKLEVLGLDLNLPAAPEDDLRESKFSFRSNDQVLVFAAAASPLVGCHY